MLNITKTNYSLSRSRLQKMSWLSKKLPTQLRLLMMVRKTLMTRMSLSCRPMLLMKTMTTILIRLMMMMITSIRLKPRLRAIRTVTMSKATDGGHNI